MCDVRYSAARVRHAAILTLMLGASPSRLGAQDVEHYRAKVERLAAHLDAVRAQARAADSMPALDTVEMGSRRFLVRPERRGFLAEAADITWDTLVTELGADTALIPDAPLLVEFARDERIRVPQGVGLYLIRHIGGTEEVAAELVRYIKLTTWEGLDADLLQWIRSPSGFAPLTKTQAEVVYTELATAPWESVRRCYDGEVAACARVLDLESAADTASLWYTPEEQRRAIERHGGSWWMTMTVRTSPDYIGCVDGDDRACAAFLNEHMWIIGWPLSVTARESMLRVALAAGGEGVLGRLAQPGAGSTGSRLAAAAGIPRDSLIALWRDRILAAAPDQVVLTGSVGGTALLWVLLLVLIAMRSTRWREP